MCVSRILPVAIAAILLSACGATLVPYAEAELAPLPELSGRVEWEIAQAVQRAAEAFLEESRAPGVQVALRVGEFSYAGAYGHRDSRRREFPRVDDIYRVGSVTKMFSAVVVLQLAGDGRLSLEDTIGGWVDLPQARSVTVRQLLNHTSGIPDYTDRTLPTLGTMLRPRRRWRPEQLVSRVRRQELLFAPGSAYSYSSTNYVILGIIAEAVSGRPLAELYQSIITGPLGLRSTHFLPYQEAPDPARLVTGYERDLLPFGTQRITLRKQSWLTYAYSAGAMVSTAADLVRFADSLFLGELLDPPLLAEMTAFIGATDAQVPLQTGYGLGLRRLELDGSVLLGHSGTTPGFGAIVMHAPAGGYTIAAAGNLSRLDSVALLQAVVVELQEVAEWRLR